VLTKRGRVKDWQCDCECYALAAEGIRRAAVSTGVKGSLLGAVRIRGCVVQVTYAGHPLYRYRGDVSPGATDYVGPGSSAASGARSSRPTRRSDSGARCQGRAALRALAWEPPSTSSS